MTTKILYTALSSTGTDVYHQKAEDNVKKPYILYNKITQTLENHLQGSLTNENSRFQVDIYDNTYANAKTIETEVRTAIENITDAKPIIYSIVDLSGDGFTRIKLDIKLWT